MVTVALDHILQQSLVLRVDTSQTVLVDHEDTLTVADIELGGRHRVVRRAVGIAAKGLQLLYAPCHQRLGDGCTHTSMVLVHVHALQLQLLTVQQEALVGIEGDVADACCRFIDVGHPTTDLYRCFHLI